MTKSVSPAVVRINEPVTYTISLTNSGTAIASGVRLTDVLPAGAAWVDMVSGIAPAITSPVVVWPNLTIYDPLSLTFSARMPGVRGVWSNVVTATYEIASVGTGETAAVEVRNPNVNLPLVIKNGYTCTPDAYEPNDHHDTAYVLSDNTILWANFCGADRIDEYKFTSTGAAITLVLTDISVGNDYDLYLYHQIAPDQFELKEKSARYGSADERIQYVPPGPGTYLVQVHALTKGNTVANEYRLQVTFK